MEWSSCFYTKLVFPYMKGRSHTDFCAYVGQIREADIYLSYLRSIGKVFIASVNTVTRKVRVLSPGCGIGKRDRRIRWDENGIAHFNIKDQSVSLASNFLLLWDYNRWHCVLWQPPCLEMPTAILSCLMCALVSVEMNQNDNAATESDLFLLTKTLSPALRGDSELHLFSVNYRVKERLFTLSELKPWLKDTYLPLNANKELLL